MHGCFQLFAFTPRCQRHQFCSAAIDWYEIWVLSRQQPSLPSSVIRFMGEDPSPSVRMLVSIGLEAINGGVHRFTSLTKRQYEEIILHAENRHPRSCERSRVGEIAFASPLGNHSAARWLGFSGRTVIGSVRCGARPVPNPITNRWCGVPWRGRSVGCGVPERG